MAFPGMGERLQQEVRTLAPDSMQVLSDNFDFQFSVVFFR